MLTAATSRDLWRARVIATPDSPFILDGPLLLSFGEADVAMLRIAGALRELGVGPGTRVMVGMGNSARAILVHAALRELGAVIVPLLPGLRGPELAYQATHCQAPVLLAEEPVTSTMLAFLDSLPHVNTVIVPAAAPPAGRRLRRVELEELQRHEVAEIAAPPGHDARSPSAILYTSGSTGRPKGVVLPSGTLSNAGFAYSERFGITAQDNLLVATPVAHAVGAITKVGMALVRGCRITILDRFSPRRFWSDVAASEATSTVLFPAQLNLLLQIDDGPAPGSSPLRLVITHAWIDRFRSRFGVELGLCWGMTETGAAGAGTPPGYRPAEGDPSGAVGPAMDGVQLDVRDEQGIPVPAGTEGELWSRNEHGMLEYLDDEEATHASIVDGWLRTGDRAMLDERGWLFYRGRVKNMIKRSGENISPLEIETVLDGHESVEESLVIGIPDELRSEEVVALVALRDGAELAPDELSAYASERLARWKLPRYIALRDASLPRLPNGKIDRVAALDGFDVSACWDARAKI